MVKAVPFIDVAFDDVPQEILWLHTQAKKGMADKFQGNEAAFVIGPGDIQVCESMSDWLVVILGYKPKVEIH